MSCKKEKQPPAELIGRWENRFAYIENHISDSITILFDTIPIYNRRLVEYKNDFTISITPPTIPSCEGTYQLIRNDQFIEWNFPCHVINGINNGKYILKVYKLTSDTLILEDSFENGFSRTTLIKIK